MPVLWITVVLSLLLALVFLALFVKEHRRSHFGSPERSALLPLEEDVPVAKVPPPQSQLARPVSPPSSPRRP